MREEIRNLLAHVCKPYRLSGGEVGSQIKNWDEARVRLCLAFPEAYELGMSNIGLAILYDILGGRPDTVVERVYAPWADVESELRARDLKLFSLESQHALHEFDVVGVALPYELTYTNVLNILALGGIPLLSRDRDERHPLVIAGGPCAFNPEPIAEVFDAIVVGDGEDAIIKIADAVEEYKKNKTTKDELLKRLATIRGIYVPSYYCHSDRTSPEPLGSGRESGGIPCSKSVKSKGSLDYARDDKQSKGSLDCARDDRQSKGSLEWAPATKAPAGKRDDKAGIRKAIVTDLDSTPFPTSPLVPHAATQDRAAIEVQRGCVRGCRFCQAGMTYRPVRQRSPETVCDLARAQLGNSGHDALSLVSLSVGDYACLSGVLAAMNENHARVTLPSLRVESLTSSVLECLGKDRAGSFTLAPEAATERMRRMINKGNTDDDLYTSVEKVFQNGWSKIKLYFMVGLPGETDDEIDGIVKVANRCLDIGRRHHKRPDVTVATSTFVPKAHTPLQWAGQISIDSTLEIQRKLKRFLRRPGLYYRWQNAEMSLLECAMSRGGRELMPVIMHAYQNGVRFDGWDDCFRMDVWRAAFAANDLDIDFYRAARGREDRFPWDHLFVDLKKEFLWREYERAMNGETTPNCIDGPCQNCGVCDFKDVTNKMYDVCHREEREERRGDLLSSSVIPSEVEESLAFKHSKQGIPPLSRCAPSVGMTSCRVRLKFSKLGGTAYLGHLELAEALRRTVRRAGVNVAYTQGYRPRPKIDLGRALPVGIESSCEYIDVTFEGSCDTNDLCTVLNAASPEGIRFTEAIVVEESTASIEESIVAANYEVDLGGHAAAGDAISVFNARETAAAHVIRKGKTREIDVKSCVSNLAIREGDVLSLTLSHRAPTLKIGEVLAAIMGFSNEVVSELHVMKVGVHFREAGSRRQEARGTKHE